MAIRNQIQLEVMGAFAMFARPDTGSTPVSYPIPTYSAVKGMFEAVARVPWIYMRPLKVEICKPVRYERYVTNYGGPLRKSDQFKKDNNYQLIATVLVDVHYRLYAELVTKRSSRGEKRGGLQRRRYGKDPLPTFKKNFETRLAAGQTFYTPCLGWKEFVPTYFGPLKPNTRPDESVNEVIPSLLHEMWERKRVKPRFVQDWEIVDGVMSYERRRQGDA